MEISTKTTIQSLIDLGLIKSTQVEEWNKKSIRLQLKADKELLITGTSDAILELMNGDMEKETKFFSVKKTSNSTGLMSFINTDRATVLKSLTRLVKSGLIVKVGVIGGEIKSPLEVNAFQIRYMRS